MAEIVLTEGGGTNIDGAFGPIKSMLHFLFSNWYWFAIAIFFVVFTILIIYLISKIFDMAKERDEPGYAKYKMTINDCKNNANLKNIRKRYSLKNLFWLGIPILNKDLSKRVVEKFDNLIGRYRGEVQSQDGTWNYLICKKRILGIVDSNILLKVPTELKWEDKDSEKGKSKKTELIKLDLVKEYDGYIKIDCLGIEKVGMYYHMPVIELNDKKGNAVIPDLRKAIEGVVVDNTYQLMTQRLLNTGSRMMEKAMTLNPRLKYEQSAPEKKPEEEDGQT